jgi:hypothetical protein
MSCFASPRLASNPRRTSQDATRRDDIEDADKLASLGIGDATMPADMGKDRQFALSIEGCPWPRRRSADG